jgi:hypothetical protein
MMMTLSGIGRGAEVWLMGRSAAVFVEQLLYSEVFASTEWRKAKRETCVLIFMGELSS